MRKCLGKYVSLKFDLSVGKAFDL